MPKKIKIFILLFVILGLVAVILILKGSPKTKFDETFKFIRPEDIVKIKITAPLNSVTLERKEDVWFITHPVSDIADSEPVKSLLGNVMDFSVGSIVSESEKNYPEFGLSSETAKHFQVFLDGKDEPRLDGYFGNAAIGYSTLYFRFKGDTPVYMVDGIPPYVFQRSPENYREKDVFDVNFDEVLEIFVGSKEGEITLVRSSDSWNVEGRQTSIDKGLGKLVVTKLKEMVVEEYEDGEGSDEKFGLKTPSVIIELVNAESSMRTILGSVKVNKTDPKNHYRYAQAHKRNAVLLVSDNKVKDLITFLHNVVK